MSSSIKEKLERVSLVDELSQETQHKPEEKEAKEIKDTFTPSENDDFEEPIHEEEPEKVEAIEEEPEEEQEEFDPEESAAAAIDIIDVLQQSIFMPITSVKLQKRYGGKENLKAMRAAVQKHMRREKLSDDEKKLVDQMNSFNAQLSKIREEIPFDPTDVAALKPGTIRYCEKNGIKVNENLAFGAGIVKVLSKRVIDLILI